jgi:hypothetical protein
MLRYNSEQTYEFKDLSLPLFKNNSTIPDKRYLLFILTLSMRLYLSNSCLYGM